ncbi:PadR family transcriptional regulator [Demequina sp. TTPB684]|uniref:PadR family transcriptional regulator n=1 Tax=unclassified Demequina TaxID=2620311 RepID=UPI001CF3D564|nr:MULTISPECIES: PadR family transcriptional regulator [unclassified Demequina]MCB2412322.1 PadR family transcriptional regulator [Demequina sp. TTPB684]UPU89483.1 PadR family transcriptional regulator [Demequina sp. TMPB413]
MADLREELSETMYCILLALREERHGYGVIQHVTDFTAGYVQLGAGTVYTSLKKLERAGWIDRTRTEDRRHYYVLTERGRQALADQTRRIERLHAYGKGIA